MKVRGDIKPSAAFSIEKQPKHPGYCLVRFYENAKQYTEKIDGKTHTGWEYNEYHLELFNTGNLAADVANNLANFLQQAKDLEPKDEIGDLKNEVANLETQLAESDEVCLQLYEAQYDQEQINAEQDGAILELFEMIGG